MNTEAKRLNMLYKEVPTLKFIKIFLDEYKGKIAFSSSFGAEDQVLIDLLMKYEKKVEVFTLDTGRLPNETYTLIHEVNKKYQTKISVYFPTNQNVEKLYREQGINGFYNSIENRKSCCYIRKVEPLKRALNGVDIWITGLRAEQSITRTDLELFQWDDEFKVIKLNPLILWSEEEVWEYIKQNNLPYNELHDKGFPSIGCAPCTRAIKEGESLRSGRWWWEKPEHKECGLHKG